MIPFLLKNWLLIACGAALAAFLGLLAYNDHLKHVAEKAKAQTEAATQSANLATNTVRITEHFHTTETIIREKAEEQAHAVEQIPSDDVPADVLDSWRLGLRNTRAAATDNPSPK
jgi:hypothetical protein